MDLYQPHRFICRAWIDQAAFQLQELSLQIRRDYRRDFSTALLDRDLFESLKSRLYAIASWAIIADLKKFSASKVLYISSRKKKAPPQLLPNLTSPERLPVYSTSGSKLDHELAYQRYFDWIINPLELPRERFNAGIDAFYRRNPRAWQLFERACANFHNNIREACQRVARDWPDIENCFVSGELRQFKKIINTGSDSHKGGRQVLLLDFEYRSLQGKPGMRRIVYKPSDVEVDYRLVGKNTPALNSVLQKSRQDPSYPIPSQSLFSLLNEFLREKNRAAAAQLTPDEEERRELRQQLNLPTYLILPRYPGSRLTRTGGGKVPIERSYGYLEFITHQPQEPPHISQSTQAPNFLRQVWEDPVNRLNRFRWDWVTDDPAAGECFMRVLGRLIAAAYIFQLTDLHHQNQIVHRHKPYLIDMENSFVKKLSVPDDTGILQGHNTEVTSDLEVQVTLSPAGIGTMPVQPGWQAASTSLTRNQLYLYSQNQTRQRVARITADTALHKYQLTAGLQEMLETLRRHKQDILDWMLPFGFNDHLVRHVPIPTEQFVQQLQGYISSALEGFTSRGEPVSEDEWFARKYQAARSEWIKKGRPAEEKLHFLEQPQHNWRDFRNLDIPGYYRRISGVDLLNSHGEVVSNPGGRHSNYFRRSCMENIIAGLNRLPEDEGRFTNFLRQTVNQVLRMGLQQDQLAGITLPLIVSE